MAIIALLISSGFGLAFPLVIVRLLDSVTKAASFAPLNNLAFLLAGIFLLQAAFSFVQSYLLAFVGEHIVYDLRTSLYGHLQQLSLDFYANRRVGDVISRLSSDVTQMRTMLTNNLTTLLSSIVTLVGAIVIVLTLNARLTLFIIALIPAVLVVAFLFGSRIQKGSTRVQDQLADSTVVAEEGLQGIRVVKSFGRETYETRRYDTAMEKTFQASLQMAVYNSAFGSVMMFLGFGSIAAVMWYGGREVIAGRLTLAMITGFLMPPAFCSRGGIAACVIDAGCSINVRTWAASSGCSKSLIRNHRCMIRRMPIFYRPVMDGLHFRMFPLGMKTMCRSSRACRWIFNPGKYWPSSVQAERARAPSST